MLDTSRCTLAIWASLVFALLGGCAEVTAPDAPPVARGEQAPPDSPLDPTRAPQPELVPPSGLGASDGSGESLAAARTPGGTRVTVVDAAGLPVAGMAVLPCRADDDAALRRLDWGDGKTTGPDGTVAVVAATGQVATRLFGGTVVRSTPSQPDRIVLPPTGAIRLDLRGWPPGLRVALRVGDLALERPEVGPSQQLLIEHVPLGQHFILTVQARRAGATDFFDGPGQAGEVVVRSPAPDRSLRVRVRIVRSDGLPVGVRSASLEWKGRNVLEVRRSPEGGAVFSNDVSASDWDPEAGDTLHVGLVDKDWTSLRAPVQMTGPDEHGVVDLGTVVLEPPTRVVSGVVLDASLQPVEGATVSVVADVPLRLFFGGRTGPDGRFEVDAPSDELPPPGTDLRVRAKPRGVPFHLEQPFAVGDRGVRLVLPSTGTLVVDGSRLDPRLGRQLLASVTRNGPPIIEEPLGSLESARQVALPAGAYSVVLSVGSSEFARVHGIDVVAGEVTECLPASLAAQTARFAVRTLRPVGPDGQPVPNAQVHYRRSGGALWPALPAEPRADGAIECVVALDGSIQTRVSAPGLGEAWIGGGAVDGNVVLEPVPGEAR